ncbi:MAG: hypothetical protein AAFU64_03475, partial [Bacteroidota bacterium]
AYSKASAQVKKDQEKKSFGERLVINPNIGFSIGDFTSVDLSPTIGYRVQDKIVLGLGPSYLFFKNKQVEPEFKSHNYGGRIFGQYQPWDWAFIRAEAEAMSVEIQELDLGEITQVREWQFAPLLGLGIQPKLLGMVRVQLSVLYNLNHQEDRSWRNTPWVTRFGVSF